MAVYSYVADITSIETRTKRMGWLDAVWYGILFYIYYVYLYLCNTYIFARYMGGPLGTLMGGWLYQSYGTVAVFAVSGVLWLVCIFYVVVVVKESIVKPVQLTPKGKPYRYVLDLGRAVFKRYPQKGRFHLLALIAVKLGIFLVQGHQVNPNYRFLLAHTSFQFYYFFLGLLVGTASTWLGCHSVLNLVRFG